MLNTIKKSKYIMVIIMAFSLAVLSLPVNAQTTNSNQSVDQVLCSMGLGCYSDSTSTKNTAVNKNSTSNKTTNTANGVSSSSSSSGGFFSWFFGSSNSNKQAIIYGATIAKAYTSNSITLVRVARFDSIAGELKPDEQVYEIIRGKKHLIPNLDIFIDYGFKPQQVQFILWGELNKYPTLSLFQVQGDKTKTTYYISGNGMRRRVLSQEVLESYAGRTEDIVIISQKEFNYYPEDKYIYLENPFSGDIYMIDGDAKRYLTPMAVRRLSIQANQVSPINETEFNTYKIGKPVVY